MRLPRGPNCKWVLQGVMTLVPLVILITFVFQKYSQQHKGDGRLHEDLFNHYKVPKRAAKPCIQKDCPDDFFSFFMHSGASNVVPAKICFQNKLVLGAALNNVGSGLNIVVIDGKAGKVTNIQTFDMYSGETQPLVDFLKNIKNGSVVLMASYDEPATKLSEEARNLIAELGSTLVKSLGFRDNWLFVGAKAITLKNHFEKHIKSDDKTNVYEKWPEIIDIDGCIPKHME